MGDELFPGSNAWINSKSLGVTPPAIKKIVTPVPKAERHTGPLTTTGTRTKVTPSVTSVVHPKSAVVTGEQGLLV